MKKKLTLDEFKAKAKSVKPEEVLAKIQGGDFMDCHGCPTTWSKFQDYLWRLIPEAY